MAVKIIRFFLIVLTTLSLAAILGLFMLGFFFPESGPFYIMCAAGVLVIVGVLFAVLSFLERRSEHYQLMLTGARRYLSITLRVVLLSAGIVSLMASLTFYFLTWNSYFLVMTGCLVAFIMVIILIELFLRILLPLAGVNPRS
ncbi:MAG TPA: hypothetical protein ENN69_07465 [Spirochaetia bacterium]|nr:hypothetical protein [Spirochaetia bacterium]